MSRTMWLLIGAGTCVLGLLLALLHQVNSSTSSPPTITASRDTDLSRSGVASDRTGSAPVNGTVAPGRKPFARMPVPQPSSDSVAPAPPEPKVDTENLHYGGTQLRAQTAAVEPLVQKCLDAEVAAGRPPTGTAMLTYIVAKRGDKYVVEDTGVDEDKTTVQGEALLTCLRETSRAMKFEGLPKSAEALTVSRRVSFERGKLTENKHVGFSYLQ